MRILTYFFGKVGEVYNVCSGKIMMMEDILNRMIRLSGKNLSVKVSADLINLDEIKSICGDRRKLQDLLNEVPK